MSSPQFGMSWSAGLRIHKSNETSANKLVFQVLPFSSFTKIAMTVKGNNTVNPLDN